LTWRSKAKTDPAEVPGQPGQLEKLAGSHRLDRQENRHVRGN
jgi:hypothetical protein